MRKHNLYSSELYMGWLVNEAQMWPQYCPHPFQYGIESIQKGNVMFHHFPPPPPPPPNFIFGLLLPSCLSLLFYEFWLWRTYCHFYVFEYRSCFRHWTLSNIIFLQCEDWSIEKAVDCVFGCNGRRTKGIIIIIVVVIIIVMIIIIIHPHIFQCLVGIWPLLQIWM
jgi:hypothetical protein